ncbi:MAG: hypothetical protein LR011_13285, partial [Verrucomicrobia bacterium]|nr:hypothetical protein [Verrucomicrobiota bacterium]
MALMVSAMESLTAPIELPDPIILFTFDDVSEGALPAGWTAENWSSGPGIEEENFQHLGSPVFNDWVIVNGTRFNNPMGVYSNAALDNTDYQRVLQNRSDNIVNGEVISSLAQGNILFANSGYHQGGGSQILFLETSDIDLSGHSDIFISFHSLYEQNQDSSGSLEYSVDGGDTWLPILYMLDQDDIVRSSETGEIDGLETMVLEHGDWAFSSDGSFGGKFSDFIRVDPFDVDLAPFISGRVNDDPVESKRVELFRLPAADNQQRVKFRFSLTGTDSWYWGIDNFGIYSIPELRLVNLSPVDGATGVSPDGEFLALIEEGSSERLDQASIQLLLDGNPVTPTIDREGNVVTIRHNPEGLFAPRSQHSFQLTYASLASGAEPVVLTIGFSVLDYPVLAGATLLHKEDFESVTPGQLPTGWSVANHTTSLIPFYDLQDYSSDAFLDWVVIGTEELDGIVAIEPGLNRLRSQPEHLFINDQKIDQLIQGNFIVAISGWRTGNQIQYLFTRDYDLSSSANPGIVFHSIYEQNQDSMGSVEYSIDGGLTWFPLVYMLDAPDIISGDAVGTFNTRHADVATYVDEESGETLGGTYGSFIGAEVSPQLAAFISARVNDNPLESKRIEIFRLPQAAGQSKVRLRFAYSGTNSYYFGIDELAFYELTGVEPTRLLTQSPLDQATGVSPEAALAIVVQNGTDTSLNLSSIQV